MRESHHGKRNMNPSVDRKSVCVCVFFSPLTYSFHSRLHGFMLLLPSWVLLVKCRRGLEFDLCSVHRRALQRRGKCHHDKRVHFVRCGDVQLGGRVEHEHLHFVRIWYVQLGRRRSKQLDLHKLYFWAFLVDQRGHVQRQLYGMPCRLLRRRRRFLMMSGAIHA